MELLNETSKSLHELLEYIGLDPEPYSGRGMYGKECLSVTVDSDGVGALFFELGVVLGRNRGIAPDGLLEYYTDNMGYETVVYWKHAVVTSETDEA